MINKEAALQLKIIDLARSDKLSTRAFNCLYVRGNLRTIEDVTRLNDMDLLRIKNVGVKTFLEIERLLLSYGLSLRKDEKKK